MKKIKISNTVIITCSDKELQEVLKEKSYPDFCKKRGNQINIRYVVYREGYDTVYYFTTHICNRDLMELLIANLICENFSGLEDYGQIYFKAKEIIEKELDTLDI